MEDESLVASSAFVMMFAILLFGPILLCYYDQNVSPLPRSNSLLSPFSTPESCKINITVITICIVGILIWYARPIYGKLFVG